MSFNPSPIHFGSSKESNIEAILESLKQAVGTAFNTENDSIVWIYLNAIARVFNDIFEQNRRFSYQWDPERITDFLSRWEKIYGINPLPTDTFVDRRLKLESKMSLVGQSGTLQVLQDLLISILTSDVFLEISTITLADANSYVPGGATIPGGLTIPDGDWYSNLSYIPIKVVQPDYMDDLTFYNTVYQIFTYLTDIVPAWVTFDWYREGSGSGFILDDEHNLDNEAFDA